MEVEEEKEEPARTELALANPPTIVRTLQYQGLDIYQACVRGDFPLVVLLWGMANAERVQLIQPDEPYWNNPLHFACGGMGKANADVVNFLLQQAPRGLVDVPNKAGETPLIRASSAGHLNVVLVLMRHGCNVNLKDAQGNTAAHHAAKHGHVWVLHYLLHGSSNASEQSTIAIKEGVDDRTGRNILHWACVGGHRSMIIYLLSSGLNPNSKDGNDQTALHIAANFGDVGTTQLLLRYGACIDVVDKFENTPLSIVNDSSKFKKLQRVLQEHKSSSSTVKEQTSSEVPMPPFTEIRPTRPFVVLLCSIPILVLLSLSTVVPWFIYLPALMGILFHLYIKFKKSHACGTEKSIATMKPTVPLTDTNDRLLVLSRRDGTMTSNVSWAQSQPENAMGIWLGWALVFQLCLLSLFVESRYEAFRRDYQILIVTACISFLALIALWLPLAVFPNDPGQIQTYDKDFPSLLQRAKEGVAPTSSDCATCMIRKPMRSKHCRVCGVCIARMDHHCIWINRCVGYFNHKLFLAFLFAHMISSMLYFGVFLSAIVYQTKGLQYGLGFQLLMDDYFPVVIVLLWAFLSMLGLLSLFFRQLRHVARNITENEAINWKRYDYMTEKATGDGSPVFKNSFDRGIMANLLEFIGLGRHRKNYMNPQDAVYHLQEQAKESVDSV